MYIEEFIAKYNDWEERLANPPYCIKITRDCGYIMFKYNQLDSDFSLPVVQECRGIIFREKDMKCVCRPYKKFFNYGETFAATIDWDSDYLTKREKIDGSLIKVWYDSILDEWRISTNGTIDAFMAPIGGSSDKSYGDLFIDYCCDKKFDFYTLSKSYTHLFELVSPLTRVVIPYPKLDVYYLTSIRTDDYNFWEDDFSLQLQKYFNLPQTISSATSLENIISIVQELDWTHEGFVVDDGVEHLKVKSPAYVLAHYGRMNGNLSWESLINIILSNEVEEFLTYADEWTEKINLIRTKMFKAKQRAEALSDSFKAAIPRLDSRAQYATLVKDANVEQYEDFLFKIYTNQNLTWEEYTRTWPVSRWVKFLELKGA